MPPHPLTNFEIMKYYENKSRFKGVYFCIGFIDFMFKGKSLTEYTNVSSPNDFKRNDDTILKYFMSNT